MIIDELLDFRWERRPISWRRRQLGSSSLALVGSLSCYFYCDNSYISMYVRPKLISKQTRLKLWFYAFEATINWITYHGGQFEYVRKTLSMSHKKNLFENNSCPRLPVLFHLHRPLYATTLNHYYNLSELKVIRDAMLNS